MRPARIILIAVALIAGGLAAILVTRGGSTPEPSAPQAVATQIVPEAKVQVLVASRGIGVGERLLAESTQWQDWPEQALRPEFVTVTAMPEAQTELIGAIARFELFPGEPIREAKLVRSDSGYLSAVLAPGKRGVSVAVSPVSSAGGFVVPNDHVDVVLTTPTDLGQQSELILSDVRVLAIGTRLGEMGQSGGSEDPNNTTPPTTFVSDTIATLELDPGQAETLINSSTRGQLSLTLRSVADFNRSDEQRFGSNQPVRLIRYGREQNVVTSAGQVSPVPAETAYDSASLPEVQTGPAAPQVLPQ
ncbi:MULTISPECIES: Flp pilus assembly protein CpaB [unclassified Devosia]|uniref:Flp pilus assembly protein CpaB n=1 Tax=unclassified Devosia TaxID=196773 RepID=UPI00145C516E|nr:MULTISPECIES: Flp pilus assembly protein CpaB [unclassified Devosia]MBJ6988798.1 Flp pilus assembly protein CpaB [Devosia sp. MC521]QMW63067.1 Flp pilus assembly protein CpaB [Devosia sp. MC521]